MEKARIYFEKAYQLANTTKDFNFKKMAADNMAEIESDDKNYHKALIYREDFEKWNDSINDQNSIWAIADFEKKYAVGQKQKQIKVLEVKNKAKISQRNNFVITTILMFILLIAGIVLLIQKIKINKIILLQKVELDKLLHDNIAITNGAYNLLDNLFNWALIQTKQLYFQMEPLYLIFLRLPISWNFGESYLFKKLFISRI